MTTLPEIAAEARNLIARYDALVERAIRIVEGIPATHSDISERDSCRLAINGEVAVLSWSEMTHGHEDEGDWITTERAEFPVDMLLMDDAAFEAWDAGSRERQDNARAERERRHQAYLRQWIESVREQVSAARGVKP